MKQSGSWSGTILRLCFVVAMSVAFFAALFLDADFPVVSFDDHWDIEIDGQLTEDTSLTTYVFPHMMNRRDEMVMTTVYPEEVDYRSSFDLIVYLTTVDVYLDDKLIYTYGHDLLDAGKMVGSGYHFVSVPEGSNGKTLRIELHAGEDNAFSSIPSMSIVPADMAMVKFARDHIMLIFVCIFLYLLGIVLMVGSLLGIIMKNGFRQVIWVGSFSFLVGTWSMCTSKVIQLFSGNLGLNATLEYVSLYLAIVPLFIQLYYQSAGAVRWKKIALSLCVAAIVGYTAVALFLHYTDISHLCETLPYFHILMGVTFVVLVIAALRPLSELSLSDRIMYIGFVFLFVMGMVDLFRFVLQKFFLTNYQNLSQSMLPMGALIFIVFLIVSYLIYTYSNIVEETNRKTLERLAYQDPLTGLYNRARCEALFKKLDRDDRGYLIVNMDLNGLKKTNDTYGHQTGDKLIQTFAKNLSRAFDEHYSLIRMGGDEFVIIGKEKDHDEVMENLKKVEKYNKQSSGSLPVEVAAAWGVATSSEPERRGAEAVYHLADQRMYEMKVRMKHER